VLAPDVDGGDLAALEAEHCRAVHLLATQGLRAVTWS
jgi:hypothetical protein